MAMRLRIETGQQAGTVVDVNAVTFTIGREADCDLVLADPQVSRHHASIEQRPDGIVVEDLGSANGTLVDGVRLAGPQALRGGERLQMADTVLVVEMTPAFDRTVVRQGMPPEQPMAPPPPPPPAPPVAPPPPVAAPPGPPLAPPPAAPPPPVAPPVAYQPSGGYPIRYEADYAEKRSRLTTFFRLLMIIPLYIVGIFYGIAVFVTAILAWFALLFTARYPQGLYDFNAGFVRWVTRYQAYFLLVTDAYPPFGLGPDDNYPVRVHVAPPQERYSRAKTFFRFILSIPVWVLRYVFTLLLEFVAFAAWWVIVITGKQLPGIHNALTLGMAYTARSDGYLLLLTERYPPLSEPGELEAGRSPAHAAFDPPQPPA